MKRVKKIVQTKRIVKKQSNQNNNKNLWVLLGQKGDKASSKFSKKEEKQDGRRYEKEEDVEKFNNLQAPDFKKVGQTS